ALYTRSLETALSRSKTQFHTIDLYEASSTGIRQNDATETNVLNSLCRKDTGQAHCHVTSSTWVIGNTRTASALFSVIKTALCLHYRLLPSNNTLPSGFKNLDKNRFCFIDAPAHWKKQTGQTTRKACVASLTMDGACAHVILEEERHQNKQAHAVYFSDEKNPGDVLKTNSNKDVILKTNPRQISKETIQEIQNQLDINRPELLCKEALICNFEGLPAFDPGLIAKGTFATTSAHEKFLEFSQENMRLYEKQFKTLTRLAENLIQTTDKQIPPGMANPDRDLEPDPPAPATTPLLDRNQCLEFAVGKAGNVLGKKFDIIDTYPVRVRLPAEPLMLVDRIMDIQGEMLSFSSGKIITQHDVKENAWYLDGGKAPVSISIEAGQADLFLCAWLGIDHVIKGTRKYRLLDAKVTFHRSLPQPGETIEYHIEIDRFLKQADVYLFFFHYKGYINDQLLISMRDGCAGFFTDQEVENSGGIILKTQDLKKTAPKFKFSPFVPVTKTSFCDEKIEALRHGNIKAAFGNSFSHVTLGKKLILPGGRMHLVDRVLEFDPQGGRFGLGSIIAEADIHPDDWFLICHFIGDRVMPGTLMYECCAHALRIFTQRMGWISDRDDVFYDVVPNNESDLKCRGPVTPETKKARYEIEIKEMGYAPEPYVIADAHMFSDALRIVLYKNMGMKIKGLTKQDLETFWRKQ
ncbi:MAG: hypothetical protein KKD66_11115, partial [Proteobacteria bacterium]|nr:hypothetical protein [Pseudomonadota bacterium]